MAKCQSIYTNIQSRKEENNMNKLYITGSKAAIEVVFTKQHLDQSPSEQNKIGWYPAQIKNNNDAAMIELRVMGHVCDIVEWCNKISASHHDIEITFIGKDEAKHSDTFYFYWSSGRRIRQITTLTSIYQEG